MSESYEQRLILASSSPQRRDLLARAGIDFEVVAPTLEEPDEGFTKLPPVQQAEALAYFKARTVADEHPGCCVLGADTIVALGMRVLGKPADRQEAQKMLEALSGTRQAVITGVAIIDGAGNRLIASQTTYVTMRTIEPAELQEYLDSGEWIGKAGAYAMQATGDRFVDKIEGSFTNVVGLPMELVAKMLEHIRQAKG